jgi:hypothetical protein
MTRKVPPPWERLKYNYREDPEFSMTMDAFKEMRVVAKKPVTDFAEYLLTRELENLYKEDIGRAIRTLEICITRNWLGQYGDDKPLVPGMPMPNSKHQRFIGGE